MGELTPKFHMFFYGTLMDPTTLQWVLELPSPPVLRPATVTGFAVKMWGVYPVLIREHGKICGDEGGKIRGDGDDNIRGDGDEKIRSDSKGLGDGHATKITGMVWELSSPDQLARLQAYETEFYTWCECEAELVDGGEKVRPCRTFVWAEDPESEESLEEGKFDLDGWRGLVGG
ncbi:hypothetical protein MMC22_003905 [Lobaria immixta]|nr:hypothetical protein [Lobaria immixta]